VRLTLVAVGAFGCKLQFSSEEHKAVVAECHAEEDGPDKRGSDSPIVPEELCHIAKFEAGIFRSSG
jgi:hypothetical protein